MNRLMKTYLECIPCFLKQALFAAGAATTDDRRIKDVLDAVARLIPDISLESSPPEMATRVYALVKEITGVQDPFERIKEESIENALSRYADLKKAVEGAEDPLEAAVRIAIVGNLIDFGASTEFDLDAAMEEVFDKRLAIDHFASFRETLEKARHVVYLGDNAGETVFDRVLIETMGKETTYVVRDIPVINDATQEDARRSGLDAVARILPSGCYAPGTILSGCSEDFLRAYEDADLIISKGQGNFETLSEETGPLFFLLKVKCPVIARHLSAELGAMVLQDARLQGSAAYRDREEDAV